jgi:phosphohistidine phosphatase
MKRLFLLRHAKSSWDDPDQRDFDRTLNDRGRAAAPAMGRYMAANGVAPDRILVSTARRTRDTFDLVRAAAGWSAPTQFEDRIYMASSDTLLDLIQATPAEAQSLLIIGHNPGLEDLTMLLSGSGVKGALEALREKFPTATLAEVSFAVADWADVKRKSGKLDRFIRPKQLDASLDGD